VSSLIFAIVFYGCVLEVMACLATAGMAIMGTA
jgi:hypothetical protein